MFIHGLLNHERTNEQSGSSVELMAQTKSSLKEKNDLRIESVGPLVPPAISCIYEKLSEYVNLHQFRDRAIK